MKTILDEPLNLHALPFVLKRMAKSNKNFDKTEPHPKSRCKYKNCVWHKVEKP